ncbi:hypothetical protein COO60DRAFT_1637815 [Scenedesmus sp. NREL 46B-D3]|nr:hypothetical protein COO60DRAFT_1637815 [Scenedesmus sp. NREL 46B-D3]
MVLLVNKNLEKQLGRGLVQHSRLVDAHSIIHAADYALLLVGNSSSTSPAAAAAAAASKQAACVTCPVLYANQAAIDALASCSSSSSSSNAYIGVALLFDAWRHADGWLGLPGWPRLEPGALPSQQQLQRAGDAVRAQADAVRQLKQGQGLSNKDPAVTEAVAALQQLKQQLAHLEGLQQAFMPGRQRPLQQLLQHEQQGTDGQHQPGNQ